MNQPVVTISVYTYNSSKYILETLESIKEQTYPNLILQICDDCSTDNTIDLCKKWIDDNKERFVKTKIIIPEYNTGPSGNANRGWDACETEWLKEIAGDDLLLPNCIEDNLKYVEEHPDTVVVFSKVKTFRVYLWKYKWERESWHDYNFFKLPANEQYNSLIYNGNHLPAASCFCNIRSLRELNIRHDERIPLLEDYPKWLMLTHKGIKLNFMDKITIKYRLRNNSLSRGLFSPRFFKSNMLLYLYYYQKEINNENDYDKIYNLMCDRINIFYRETYNTATSLDYWIGYVILFPWHLYKKLYSKSE